MTSVGIIAIYLRGDEIKTIQWPASICGDYGFEMYRDR